MPRKSAAALSVVPPAPAKHPAPPHDLSKAEAKVWDTIVRCRPPEYFEPACHDLLRDYCRHVAAADEIARLIRETDPNDLDRYEQLLTLGVKQTNAMVTLSVKLRLAPAHVTRVEQRVPKALVRKPWEWVA